jgi:hypothetical protein
MSGGISIGFVDFPALLFDFVRVRCASISLFLVRNWCGPRPPSRFQPALGLAEGASAVGRDAEIICSS